MNTTLPDLITLFASRRRQLALLIVQAQNGPDCADTAGELLWRADRLRAVIAAARRESHAGRQGMAFAILEREV